MLNLVVYYDSALVVIHNTQDDHQKLTARNHNKPMAPKPYSYNIADFIRGADLTTLRSNQKFFSFNQLADYTDPSTMIGKMVSVVPDPDNEYSGILLGATDSSISIQTLEDKVLSDKISYFSNYQFFIFKDDIIEINPGVRVSFINTQINWTPYCHVELADNKLTVSLQASLINQIANGSSVDSLTLIATSARSLDTHLEDGISYHIRNGGSNQKHRIKNQTLLPITNFIASFSKIYRINLNQESCRLAYQFITEINIPACQWNIFDSERYLNKIEEPYYPENSTITLEIGKSHQVELNSSYIRTQSSCRYPQLEKLSLAESYGPSENQSFKLDVVAYDHHGIETANQPNQSSKEIISDSGQLPFQEITLLVYLDITNHTESSARVELSYQVDSPIVELVSQKCRVEGSQLIWDCSLAAQSRTRYTREIKYLSLG